MLQLLGSPGSRLFCPDVEATIEADVRLISIDRPGYGRSDPHPGLTVRSVADDIASVHRSLSLPPCPILGWSGGGPYALGFASMYPDLVTVVDITGTCGPWDEMPGGIDELDESDRRLRELARADRTAAVSALRERYAWYEQDPDSAFRGPPADDDPDAAVIADPDVAAALSACFREGARQGLAGIVDDWIAARAGPWGFAIESVSVVARLWWGNRDPICGLDHLDYLAARIPEAVVTIFPDEGHLVPINHWREILSPPP